MQEIYSITCQLDEKDLLCQSYRNMQQAWNAAKKLIDEQAQSMKMMSYFSALRKVKLQPDECAALRSWLEFFEKDSFEEWETEYPFDNMIQTNDFIAEEDLPIRILKFRFQNHFYMETDIFHKSMDEEEFYFFLKDDTCSFKLNMIRREKTSHSLNILLVYRYLSEEPQTSNQLSQIIWEGKTIKLSTKTIREHIKVLRQLGFSVCHKSMNHYMREYNERTDDQGVLYTEGFYLDAYATPKKTVSADASKLGTKVYPLLLLLTLKNATDPMRQSEIISSIKENYNVTIGRAAIGRHLALLRGLNYPIEETSKGYLLSK